MKIKTKLQLIVALSIGMILSGIFVSFWIESREDAALRQDEVVRDLFVTVFDRVLLLDRYLLYRTAGLRADFLGRRGEVARLLEKEAFSDGREKELVGIIGRYEAEIDRLFSAFAETGHEAGSPPGSESQTVPLLLRNARNMFDSTLLLTRLVDERFARTHRISRNAVNSVVAAASFLIIAVSFYLMRGITVPIARLSAGIDKLSSGSLDVSVGIEAEDELGHLSKSFDSMVRGLHAVTVSRRDLEDEVAVRQKAEEDLFASRQMLQLVIDTIPQRVYWKDAGLHYLGCNRAFLEDVGSETSREIFGKRDSDLPISGRAGISESEDRQIVETGTPLLHSEEHEQGPDGAARWVRTSRLPLSGKSGSVIGVLGVSEDITVEKDAELRLREAEERYRNLVEGIEAIAWELSLKTWRFTYVSPKAEEILGYPLEAWYEEGFWVRHIHPDDREYAVNLCAESTSRGENHVFDYRMVARDGRVVWLRDTVVVIQDQTGPVRLSGIMFDITEQKQAERLLTDAETRYRTLFQESPDGIVVLDPSSYLPLEFNDALCRQLGYTREEFSTLRIADYEVLERPEETNRRIVKILQEGRDDFETLQRTKDGEIRNVHVTVQTVEVQGEELLYCVFRDITERKRAERVVRQNQDRLDALFRISEMRDALEEEIISFAMEACVSLTDSEVGYLHFVRDDQRSIELYAWSKKALERCTAVKDPHYPVDRAGVWADSIRLRKPVIHNDYESLPNRKGYPDGHFPVRRHLSVPVFDGEHVVAVVGVGNKERPYDSLDGQQLSQFMNTVLEILKRKRADRAWRESEERYRLLFNSGNDAIFVHGFRDGDIPDHFTEVNDVACERLGYTREELLTLTLAEIEAPVSSADSAEVLARLFEDRHAVFGRTHLAKDGGRIPVEINSRLFVWQGRPFALHVARDVTERRRAEEDLRKFADELQRSNRELEQFAYVASHDLQEPLRKIASFTELLARRYRGRFDEKADVYVDYIVDGAKRMRTLINDLLAYSRVMTKPRDFDDVDCNEIAERVLRDMEIAIREAGATVTVGHLPMVRGDGTQIGQVFQNLLGNALRYRGDVPPEIRVTAEKRREEWVFSVADNGIGIEPQYHDRIFVIFQRLHGRTEYPGTGIGLALCRKIVERHGGRIWVESELGRGSTFYFAIPVREER